MPQFSLPRLDQRVAVVGRTGSGKTVKACWLLSLAEYDKQPFIIVDYKRDKLIADIPAIELGLHERLPKQPGVYVVRPDPRGDEKEIEAWMWKVWERERIGLFFDEMYLLPQQSRAYRAIQTQGRSKRIPTISLSQRPFWVPKFTLSEADYYSLFWLQHVDDRKSVNGFVPSNIAHTKLDEYHSHWYDLKQDHVFIIKPVPSEDEILDTFETRLKPNRKMV